MGYFLNIIIYFLFVFNFVQCFFNNLSPPSRQYNPVQQNYNNNNNNINNCPLKCPKPPPPVTCPCIKPKNSSKCFAYDSRIQATDLDEAMFSFPDMSDHSSNPSTLVPPGETPHIAPKIQPFSFTSQSNSIMSAPSVSSSSSSASGGACVSKQCEACRLHVLSGFSQALNASSQFNKRLTGHGGMHECPYVQSRQREKEEQKAKLSQMNSQNDETVNQMVNLLKQAQQKRKRRDVTNNNLMEEDDDNVNSFSSVDEADIKDKLLGVSTKISCDYIRGEALTTDSPWCGLCNICWTWRKLPPNYFPAYLNEVSCDADNACLGGFGKCRAVLRTLTVLKNAAKNSGDAEQWEQQSINTIAACECQVEAGTPLHSFIVR